MYGNGANASKGAQGTYERGRARPEVIQVLTNGG